MRPTSETGTAEQDCLPSTHQTPPLAKPDLRPLRLHGDGSSGTEQAPRQLVSAPTGSRGCLVGQGCPPAHPL